MAKYKDITALKVLTIGRTFIERGWTHTRSQYYHWQFANQARCKWNPLWDDVFDKEETLWGAEQPEAIEWTMLGALEAAFCKEIDYLSLPLAQRHNAYIHANPIIHAARMLIATPAVNPILKELPERTVPTYNQSKRHILVLINNHSLCSQHVALRAFAEAAAHVKKRKDEWFTKWSLSSLSSQKQKGNQ